MDTVVAKVRVHVTNLGLKSANFLIDASDRNSPQENRRKAIVHPQQTAVISLPYKCHANECNAIGEANSKFISITFSDYFWAREVLGGIRPWSIRYFV